MSAFSFFSANRRARQPKNSLRPKHTALRVEALEDRSLPSGVTISGFVYNDVNNDGIFQPSETPIANNPIELHNAGGAVVGSTTTNAAGFYQFNTDATVDQTQKTLTKTVTFPSTPTDFNLQGMLDQFNPSLGTLEEVDITHAGSITSDIKAENTSTSSGTTINGTVSGALTLQAPGGVNDKLAISKYAGSFNAATFDGQIDYSGTSGGDLGQKTANGSDNVVLTGAAIQAFIGTGQVQVSETGHATSTADGGGNVVVNVVSSGQATVTVVYKYVANNSIQPGNYTIVETQEPPGYFPGKNSSGGTVLNTPPGTEVIPVTITNGNSTDNDFGKLKASSLSGTVYFDANDNGSLDNGEAGIAGVTLTLTGTDTTGTAVSLTKTTDANGQYSFGTLRQGTYTVTETPPAGYLDGGVTAGSVGGTVGIEKITSIQLPANTDAVHYDFGEVKPASLSGFVYLDANTNGVMDTGDTGIANTTLTLTGTNDAGTAVSVQATSDQWGAYAFTGLRPGTYTITETPPAGYLDASDNAGTLGGTVGKDVISAIMVGMNQAGQFYNFGNKLPPSSDVGIVKTAGSTVSNYGDQLTYTLAVTNHGPGDALNVDVKDTLPPDVTFISASGDGWSVWEQDQTLWAWQTSLATGATSDIQVVVKVPAKTESLTNTATVTTTTPDNNPNNNTSTVTTQVVGPGGPTNQSVPPLIVQAQGLPIISKNQLLNFNGQADVDPNVLGKMAFVDAVHQTLTGAGANPTANLQATQSLLAGATTLNAVVGSVWNSDAHRAFQAQQLFQTYLGRNPTATEQASTMQALAAGATVQSQAEAILTSPAFQALHPSSQALASALYQSITGQTPGDLTSQGLVQSMGNETLSTVVSTLFTSPGAVSRAINQAFLDTLRRPASASELALYTPQVQAGSLTTDQLALNLLTSQEFYQLAYNSVRK